MLKIPLSELKERIVASGKLSQAELDGKIKDKINELSGLISEDGAAHIIANELGVKLLDPQKEQLKIKEIYAGMRSVTTVGKIVKKYETREFQKGERSGKVCSLLLGDETGTIRVVFWNEQVDMLDDVNEGDILRVKNVYVRENQNNREIHLGDKGEIEVNPEGTEVGQVRNTREFARKSIQELQPQDSNVEIMATVVQIFDPRFWNTCPQCNKKVLESPTEGGVAFSCHEHGTVTPGLGYVTNLIADDGTGTIRCVFWKNQTNHLVGKEEKDFNEYKENPGNFEDMKTQLLGEQFKLMGRVNKNEMFDRLEFSVQLVSKANPQEELERLQKQ